MSRLPPRFAMVIGCWRSGAERACSREVVTRVGSQGSVAGVDPNPGMLIVAERLEPSARWQEGVAESLPYDEDSFDAVLSQFGLMFFADRSAALREMKRVLVHGGRIAVAVWESLERCEAYPRFPEGPNILQMSQVVAVQQAHGSSV